MRRKNRGFLYSEDDIPPEDMRRIRRANRRARRLRRIYDKRYPPPPAAGDRSRAPMYGRILHALGYGPALFYPNGTYLCDCCGMATPSNAAHWVPVSCGPRTTVYEALCRKCFEGAFDAWILIQNRKGRDHEDLRKRAPAWAVRAVEREMDAMRAARGEPPRERLP